MNEDPGRTKLFMDFPPEIKPVSPVGYVSQMKLLGSLNCALRTTSYFREKPVVRAKPIQEGLWPVVSAVHSTLAIAGSNKGKTLGWMIPLLNQLCKELEYDDLPPGGHPRCVVLVPYHIVASTTAQMLNDLITQAELNLTINVGHYAVSNLDQAVSLMNGSDILVVTPPCLYRLLFHYDLQSNLQVVNLTRCCHLVLEDAHLTTQLFPTEMTDIVQEFRAPKDARQPSRVGPRPYQQMLVISEQWSTAVRDFCLVYFRGVVLIADMMEGLLYREIPVKPLLLEANTDKADEVVRILKDNPDERIIICCKEYETGQKIQNLLLTRGQNPVLLHEREKFIHDAEWKISSLKLDSLKIITDNWLVVCLEESKRFLLGEILILWDLPDVDPRMFKYRMSLLRGHMRRYSKQGRSEVCTYIFITTEDTVQMRFLRELLRRSRARMSRKLKLFLIQTLKARFREDILKKVSLCPDLVAFGSCRYEIAECRYRHCLDPHQQLSKISDNVSKSQDTNIPSSNSLEDIDETAGDAAEKRVVQEEEEEKEKEEIRFTVLWLENPVMYWVRLQDNRADAYNSLFLEMSMYFGNEKNRCPLRYEEIEVGALVATAGVDKLFRRAVISRLIKVERGVVELIDIVEVRYIDSGDIAVLYPSYLYRLPESFAVLEPMAKLVVLAGYKPPDKDKNWSESCLQSMLVNLKPIHLNEDENLKFICRGKVLVRTADLIWVDRCEMWEWKPRFGRYTCRFNVGSELISGKQAEKNIQHYKTIRVLAETVGLPISRQLKILSLKQNSQNWNFFPADCETQVVMTECLSPGLFFLGRADNWTIKEELERDLEAFMRSKPERVRLGFGDYVVVRPQEEEPPERGQIIKIVMSVEEDLEDSTLMVFLVDLGETFKVPYTAAYKLPDRLLKLPFQAVPCQLADILPPLSGGGRWSPEAGDILFQFSRTSHTDLPKSLYCTVLKEVEASAEYCSTDLHGVFPTILPVRLINEGDEDIAWQLVTLGLASWNTVLKGESEGREDHKSPISTIKDAEEEDISDEEEDEYNADEEEDDIDDCSTGRQGGTGDDFILANKTNWNELVKELNSCMDDTSQDNSSIEDRSLVEQRKKNQSLSVSTKNTRVLPAKKLISLKKDPSMPSLAITGMTRVEKKLPELFCSQTSTKLCISAKFRVVRDIDPKQVYVELNTSSLLIQLLEVEYVDDREEYICHMTPLIQLDGRLNPATTRVSILGIRVSILVDKLVPGLWVRLTPVKYSWVHQMIDDHTLLEEEGEEEEINITRDKMPPKGFLSKYLEKDQRDASGSSHAPRFLDGFEQAYPEQLFDENNSDDGLDYDYIKENVVDHTKQY